MSAYRAARPAPHAADHARDATGRIAPRCIATCLAAAPPGALGRLALRPPALRPAALRPAALTGLLTLGAVLAPASAQQIAPAAAPPAAIAPPAAPPGGAGPVVASGTVPDEATKAAVLARLRAVFGADRVQDQLSVGPVVAPPGWAGHVQRVIDPSLRQVGRGQMQIDGNRISLQGEVGSDAARRQIAADTQARLNPTYTVDNALRVATSDQALLDQTLANRIIEFAPSSAQLLPAGHAILDEMAATLLKLPGRRIEVIGHTDSSGSRESNIALSLARADAVKAYLAAKGVPAGGITVSGVGPDRPVASNSTDTGRARNRRIEFRIGQ